MSKDTEQFWAGEFGTEYLKRNQVDWSLRVPFFKLIMDLTEAISVLEIGTNAAWNLRAINAADPISELAGCDINEEAIGAALIGLPMADIALASAMNAPGAFPDYHFDLVLTAGVLIHIPPEEIKQVMTNIIELSGEWVLAIEYEASQEEEVLYRGHDGKLWKRPYGNLYQKMGRTLVHKQELGPQDGFGEGCTAWLLRKP